MATMNTAIPGSPYRVPPEPSRMPSIVLAALVHAGLLFSLWVGVNWQNEHPPVVEAEVWDMKTQSAAAPPEPQPVRQPPPPKPEPVEPVKPPPPPPRKVEEPDAPKPPDIALEREKKLKEQKVRDAAMADKQLEEKRRQKILADEKRELDKARKELADQKKREQDEAADKKAEQLAKDKADKLAKSKLAAAEQAKLNKLREAEMRRFQAQAGSTGSGGEAPKSTAPRSDTGYIASITSKIKSTTFYSGNTDVAGNPRVQFRVEQLPTGEILSVKLAKSSGIPAFDDAVEKGIIKSSPLPKKKDGTVERSLEIGFSMKDLN